jgi:hypothetical protein
MNDEGYVIAWVTAVAIIGTLGAILAYVLT